MYGYDIDLDLPYARAVEAVTAALGDEGFGVLSTIDVRSAMKEKLGVDMPGYVILGACNPQLAHRALQADPDIGLLLPCNVVVREKAEGGGVTVAFIDPQTISALTGGNEVRAVADDAGERLGRVRERLQAGRSAA